MRFAHVRTTPPSPLFTRQSRMRSALQGRKHLDKLLSIWTIRLQLYTFNRTEASRQIHLPCRNREIASIPYPPIGYLLGRTFIGTCEQGSTESFFTNGKCHE